jgi:hypothetical protein
MGATLAVGERVDPLHSTTGDAEPGGNTAFDWQALSGLLDGKLPASWHNAIAHAESTFDHAGTPCDIASVIQHVLDNFEHDVPSFASLAGHDHDLLSNSTLQNAMQTYLQSLSSSV